MSIIVYQDVATPIVPTILLEGAYVFSVGPGSVEIQNIGADRNTGQPALLPIQVDWGDGSPPETLTGQASHTYPEGTYKLQVKLSTGELELPTLGQTKIVGDALLRLEKYGDPSLQVTNISFGDVFQETAYSPNLNSIPSQTPPKLVTVESGSYLVPATRLAITFVGAPNIEQDVAGWDISQVTSLSDLFAGLQSMSQDLSSWDTSSVEYMERTFHLGGNPNISNWDTSSVIDFSSTFLDNPLFTGDLSGWDVSSGVSFYQMFRGASSFNSDISQWNTQSATNMERMLRGTGSFKQDLSAWCVSLIPTEPSQFNLNGILDPNEFPVWGTCPGPGV